MDRRKEKTELEQLVQEKIELWNEVRNDPDYLNTEQYKRINEIDVRLRELVKS